MHRKCLHKNTSCAQCVISSVQRVSLEQAIFFFYFGLARGKRQLRSENLAYGPVETPVQKERLKKAMKGSDGHFTKIFKLTFFVAQFFPLPPFSFTSLAPFHSFPLSLNCYLLPSCSLRSSLPFTLLSSSFLPCLLPLTALPFYLPSFLPCLLAITFPHPPSLPPSYCQR